jgi:carbamoyl-phosphate synthase large subunit
VPKRTDLKKILVIGSGPIVIGQAGEFDYSGSQACKALRSEGYQVVLVNSNPATIMTDPELADRTYVEPVTADFVARVIEKERPDALLPTMGGQTGLNTALELAESGVLDKYGVEMIGADRKAIRMAEDREEFRAAMLRIGLEVPASGLANSMEEAEAVALKLGLPVVIRPGFTLGGSGGGLAFDLPEFRRICDLGLRLSMTHQLLIEKSVAGWKEFELEVMRDCKDNVVIICSIENLDPMGVHTGDSITVAPAQTLTDPEYQVMRNASMAIIREIGVATGGSNIQFAVEPSTGRMMVIEMNPRVSRSSALASKATGFPIAKFAAKLAVGYALDEIPNDITRSTPASFEPTIDYCVVKIPRFAFEKFPGAKDELTTMMKSVGETMAIGRTFPEALQKGLRSLEAGCAGLDAKGEAKLGAVDLEAALRKPNSLRIFAIRRALRLGWSPEKINELTHIDPWFINQIGRIVEADARLAAAGDLGKLSARELREAKQLGFSDRQLGGLLGAKEEAVRARREADGIRPVYKMVDTCAAEFEASTPYYYSTYDPEDESRGGSKPKVMIIGGGPYRIGQGIEFDYCCCHASFALRELGYETIMVNSNPETVSTDYDISDRLYFEPVTLEDVLNVWRAEQPIGAIVQMGGQTPLNISEDLERAGVKILGTSTESIARAGDRDQFRSLLIRLGARQAPNGAAVAIEEALRIAERIGYPIIVRPSFVLGGRAMQVVDDDAQLREFMAAALEVSEGRPVLVDKFLEDAIEVDVDAVADGERVIIAGILEHIEQAGVHSGDAAMVLPPFSLRPEAIAEMVRLTTEMGRDLGVRGLMNVQFAVTRDGLVYVIEVNPRASRTVPFVSKATGIPWAKVAAKVMAGRRLAELGPFDFPRRPRYAVKESALPFLRFEDVDTILGPEMRSTGEVMGIDDDIGAAFAKSQLSVGCRLPTSGTVFLSVMNRDKREVVALARQFERLGFRIMATRGTAETLKAAGLHQVQQILKVTEGEPNVITYMMQDQVQLVVNTPSGKYPRKDEVRIRTTAIRRNVPLATLMTTAQAMAWGIERLKKDQGRLEVCSLQEMAGG